MKKVWVTAPDNYEASVTVDTGRVNVYRNHEHVSSGRLYRLKFVKTITLKLPEEVPDEIYDELELAFRENLTEEEIRKLPIWAGA